VCSSRHLSPCVYRHWHLSQCALVTSITVGLYTSLTVCSYRYLSMCAYRHLSHWTLPHFTYRPLSQSALIDIFTVCSSRHLSRCVYGDRKISPPASTLISKKHSKSSVVTIARELELWTSGCVSIFFKKNNSPPVSSLIQRSATVRRSPFHLKWLSQGFDPKDRKKAK